MAAGKTTRARKRLTCSLALVGAWAVGFAGLAPSAAAADMRAEQWYLDAMHVDDIWKKSTGKGIKVAVVDSGINASTASLKGQVLEGVDVTKTDGKTDDYDGHGTTMAELIAGTGRDGGIQGLAPGAKVLPVRIGVKDSAYDKNAWDIEDAIRAAADTDARIISMSIGTEFKTDRMVKAAQYARSKGKLLFAATGNNGDKDNKRSYPAALPEVVGVTATTSEGVVAEFSQHGSYVDLAAPGKDIPGWCDAKFTQYCTGQQGTSHATAIASASAALIWSAHPDWTANQVLRVMFESAGKGEDWKGKVSSHAGHGVVRPNAHLTRGLGKPGDPGVSPLADENTAAAGGGSSASPAASASPGTSAPGSSQSPQDAPAPGSTVAGSSENAAKADDGMPLGLVLGGAAAVVVVAGGAFVLARRRRTP
ncbi:MULTISPECIES: S8 family serine peptidase [Streptomyces]|uniref:Serine protease n=2 Tax=Streptomyces TaxID=1883 RepID=A0A117IV76_9ACTN|nr:MULTISPECIES: S8 family serine peptidase [Streptomyces]KUH36920.1 serine protease [Streptomyces kanasensis]UUS33246.1 S8 family serine peptidase [Streptomyces changanensis]